MHIELTSLGVKKKQHEDFNIGQAKEILQHLQRSWHLSEANRVIPAQ